MTLVNHASVEYSPESSECSETLTVDHCTVPCYCIVLFNNQRCHTIHLWLLTTCFHINSTAVSIITPIYRLYYHHYHSKQHLYHHPPRTRIPDSRLTRWRPHSELKLRPKHINLNNHRPHPLHPLPPPPPLLISIPIKDPNLAWRVHLSVIATGRTVTSMLSPVHDLQPHLPSTTRDQSLLLCFDLLPTLHSLHT
jgi:hypothetical protein